jgi:hypothetical protein
MYPWGYVFLAFMIVFAFFEVRGILTNKNLTLSRTVWEFENRFPIIAFLTGCAIGGLAIHFFGWIPACNP